MSQGKRIHIAPVKGSFYYSDKGNKVYIGSISNKGKKDNILKLYNLYRRKYSSKVNVAKRTRFKKAFFPIYKTEKYQENRRRHITPSRKVLWLPKGKARQWIPKKEKFINTAKRSIFITKNDKLSNDNNMFNNNNAFITSNTNIDNMNNMNNTNMNSFDNFDNNNNTFNGSHGFDNNTYSENAYNNNMFNNNNTFNNYTFNENYINKY